MLSLMGRRLILLVVLLALACVAAMPQHRTRNRGARRARSAVATAAVAPDRQLICRVFCSESSPGTAAADIIWKVADTDLTTAAFNTRLSRQGLEVTVFKDGFNSGLFVNISRVEENQTFHTFRDDARDIPGLEGLSVTDVKRYEGPDEGTRSENRINEESFGARPFSAEDAEGVVVHIEGLEPGVNYFWRVPSNSGGRRSLSRVVECRAPICPVDSRPAPDAP